MDSSVPSVSVKGVNMWGFPLLSLLNVTLLTPIVGGVHVAGS